MEKATINIEILQEGERLRCETEFHGSAYLIMKALTNAIKELEESIPEWHRANFRCEILEMLNDRD